MAEQQFLIRFTKTAVPCWAADWEGDPGRTLVREHAKVYQTGNIAKRALKRLQTQYPYRSMEVEPYLTEEARAK